MQTSGSIGVDAKTIMGKHWAKVKNSAHQAFLHVFKKYI